MATENPLNGRPIIKRSLTPKNARYTTHFLSTTRHVHLVNLPNRPSHADRREPRRRVSAHAASDADLPMPRNGQTMDFQPSTCIA
jgi:hypothetical protein